MQDYKMYINGQFCEAKDKATLESINPSNGEAIAKFPRAAKDDVLAAIKAARAAFDSGEWPAMLLPEKAQYLNHIAQLIRENVSQLAQIESQDTGKTIKQTTFIDINIAASAFEYFAAAATEVKGQTLNIPAPALSLTLREPIGVIAQIIPWNYPFLMASWKISQAIIMGNTVVFKPSQQASLSCLELAKIIRDSGLPKGVVNFITGRGDEIGDELAKNKDIDMISFTGSTSVGKNIMRLASENVKRVALELGGKSPNIIFADCDLEAAVNGAMAAIFMNQGQMCVAGSRILLEDSIYDKFVSLLVEKTKKLKIGDALSPETDIGPMVSSEQRKRVLDYIDIAKLEGAKLLCGGNIPKGLEKGFFIEPAVFDKVNNNMRIAQEEIFGPVVAVIRFSGVEEAVKIANDTVYGLAAMVWTKDLDKANQVSRRLQAGTVWINTYGGFYNEAPFGGYKQSGLGKELGIEGLLEYTNLKHVNIDLSPTGRSLVTSWFNV